MRDRRFSRGVLATAIAAMLAHAAAAQQLRLARSLCSSAAQGAAASHQVPQPAGGAATQRGNALLANRLEQQRDAYFAKLDAIKPFSGVYAVGQADHALADSGAGSRYSFGFEWELFDQGREQSRRQLDRARFENKAQYLQVLRDMEGRQLQENLLAVQQLRNRLLGALYERQAAALKPLLDRRRQELAAGRATKADVADLEWRIERTTLRSRHFTAAGTVQVSPESVALINRIEALVLRPNDQLADLAAQRSADAQLQSLLADRGRFLPSVKDQMSVRLYAERAKDFDRGPYNAAGVRVRIPLDKDVGRDEAIAATQELFAGQQGSLRDSLRAQLALQADRLRMKQTEMQVLQSESRAVQQRLQLACYRLDYPAPSLPGDPERDIEELTARLLELQAEVLAARLDVLEQLTQISALVKPREPQELYSLTAGPG